MSSTCSIACHDCKTTLWIGQRHKDAWRIYGGDPKYAQELTEFLNAHEGHRLEFGDSVQFDSYDDVGRDEEDEAHEATRLSDVVIDLCKRFGLPPDVPRIREVLDQEHPGDAGPPRWHVTYFYLATGMEGRADERDFGIVAAENAQQAKEVVARGFSDDPATQRWVMDCLTATAVT